MSGREHSCANCGGALSSSEEIFGLHKPLGPTPATAPIGLKTEGRFELNRISEIDVLNAR